MVLTVKKHMDGLGRSYAADHSVSDTIVLGRWRQEMNATSREMIKGAGPHAQEFIKLLGKVGGLKDEFVFRQNGFVLSVERNGMWDLVEPQVIAAFKEVYGADVQVSPV